LRWTEVTSQENYGNLSPEEKKELRDKFFEKNIVPQIKDGSVDEHKIKFYEYTQSLEPDVFKPSILSKVGSFAAETGEAAINQNPYYQSLQNALKWGDRGTLKSKQKFDEAMEWVNSAPTSEERTRRMKSLPTDIDPLKESLVAPVDIAGAGALGAIRGIGGGAAQIIKSAGGEMLSEATLGSKDLISGITSKQLAKFAKTRAGKERIKESMEFLDMLKQHSKKTHSEIFNEAINKFDQIPNKKYAGSINLERQRISNIAKQVELEIFEQQGKTVHISNEQTINEGEKILKKFKENPEYYAERVDAIKKGAIPKREEYLAHRIINADNQESFIEASRKAAAGEMPLDEFNALKDKIVDNQLKVIDPVASEYGRTLQSLNITVGRDRAIRAVKNLTKPMNDRQVKMLANLDWDNPVAVQNFVEKLPDPKLKEYFFEFWYNSILSGIPTHIVNVSSNTLWQAWQLPHRALTSGIDKVISKFSGKPREIFMKEVVPMFAGIKKGFVKGAEGAKEAFLTGELKDFSTKFNLDMGNKISSAFQRSPYKILRKLDLPVNWPSRGLKAMDVWARSIALDSQLGALAKRKALQSGKSKEFMMLLEREYLRNPTEEMMQEAAQYAKYAIFADEPGKITNAFLNIRNKIPGARLIVPFVNTIANLTKRGIEMTPGLGLALAKGQKPAEVIAKQIEGSIITLLLAHKMMKGDFTGAAPENPNERDAFYRQGKLPWSIRFGGQDLPDGRTVGGKYISYRRIEPFNTVLASVSEFYRNFIKNPNDKNLSESFLNAAKGVATNLIDSSYLQNVQNLFDEDKWKSMGMSNLTSLVPFSGFWRSINNAWEAATEGEAKIRESKNFMGAFSQVIPGLYKQKEPKLDVWGEDIVREGNFFRQWLPFKWSSGSADPVELELEKIGFYPGLPSKIIENYKGEKIKLSDSDYRDYIKTVGKQGKQTLLQIVSNESFQKLDDKNKIKLIDSQLTKIRRIWLKKVKGIATKPEMNFEGE
jgi:hypothetical protein